MATPGTQGGDNSTLRIELEDGEPQPDAFLRILPSHDGQSRTSSDGYVEGTPELLAEVAASTASYDLHHKLDVYRRARAREYIVWRVYDQAIDWFILRGDRFERLPLTPAGLYQSEVFPGLWLDPAAMIRGDLTTVAQVVQQGLATSEHAAFVARLQQTRQGN
jgi:Uma2 family endonuclease